MKRTEETLSCNFEENITVMQERFEQHFKTLGLSFEARLSKHFGSVHLTHAVVGPPQIQQVDVAKQVPAHREHSGVAESRRQGRRIKVG